MYIAHAMDFSQSAYKDSSATLTLASSHHCMLSMAMLAIISMFMFIVMAISLQAIVKT